MPASLTGQLIHPLTPRSIQMREEDSTPFL